MQLKKSGKNEWVIRLSRPHANSLHISNLNENFFNPNKAGLFEGIFSWRGGGDQFDES